MLLAWGREMEWIALGMVGELGWIWEVSKVRREVEKVWMAQMAWNLLLDVVMFHLVLLASWSPL
jgi:hypothetical protein